MAEEEKPKRIGKPFARIQRHELEFIRENCINMSDDQIALRLGRNINTIISARKKLGIIKGSRGRVENFESLNQSSPTDIQLRASQKMNEDQRKEFFKTQLTNTLYYKRLKEQFTDEDIDFYLEEWGALCLQFEDIVATEKRQIDELIKTTILGIRILRNVKVAEEEIIALQKEIDLFRKHHKDIENDPEAQEYDNSRTLLLRTMMGQSQVMSNDYQKNIDMKNKLLSELNARRKDRVEQFIKRGTTFLGLVTAFRDQQTREEHGRRMELVRMAKDKKKNEWHKPIKYDDGTFDCILMDENSILPKREVTLLEDIHENHVQKYAKLEDKKILVIDDDAKRQEFFSAILRTNKVDFASNVSKAMELVNLNNDYDLICFDFDLGLNENSMAIVEHIIHDHLFVNSDILIQSMNNHGAKKIHYSLKTAGYEKIEVLPFRDLIAEVTTGMNKPKE